MNTRDGVHCTSEIRHLGWDMGQCRCVAALPYRVARYMLHQHTASICGAKVTATTATAFSKCLSLNARQQWTTLDLYCCAACVVSVTILSIVQMFSSIRSVISSTKYVIGFYQFKMLSEDSKVRSVILTIWRFWKKILLIKSTKLNLYHILK